MDERLSRKTARVRDSVNRRTLLTGIGLAGLSVGSVGTVAARGGRTPINNEPVDILVCWSSDPEPNDFGYPDTPTDNERGVFFAAHDPADERGMFDFSKFELTSNGQSMHNTFELFHGMLVASDAPSYPLVHQGDGRYESRGQVMNFETRAVEDIPLVAPEANQNEATEIPPPIAILADDSWRAVGNDISKLETDADGSPKPNGEWGVTRVDIYSQGGGPPEYVLSLLYLMWVTEKRNGPSPIIGPIPEGAHFAAQELIGQGVSNLGGQPGR